MSIVVIQARINSSRLPGKVLLPICGIPLVVLAAKRAGNKGRNVIVATSEESSDDSLVSTLSIHNIKFFRGSLENTLQRFVECTKSYHNSSLIFRLTADNCFPDGGLLDEVEADFLSRNLDYIVCNGEESGLPYGVSVELTRLTHIRDADRATSDVFDQEHVTPYIARKFGRQFFTKYKHLNMGHYRCTIDNLDDYLSVASAFAGVSNPVEICTQSLVERLTKAPYQPEITFKAKKLALGTAQLGMTYGINNKVGKPIKKTSIDIIKTAIANGVELLDTARAYGDAETTIGQIIKDGWGSRVRIVTKLPPLNECGANESNRFINSLVDLNIARSCAALRQERLDILMLHRASHISRWRGAVWNRLIQHKKNGNLRQLGVSVQSPKELEDVISCREIEHIQLPLNILDWRWEKAIDTIKKEKLQRNLSIYLRSSLLQGLLISENPLHWKRANIKTPEKIMSWLKTECDKIECDSVLELCLRYANSLDWADAVVVGIESLNQLKENLRVFSTKPLTKEYIESINQTRPILSEKALNPALWASHV